MATISKRVNNSGQVNWQAKCRKTGFPPVSKTFTDKKTAVKWASGIERQWELDAVNPPAATVVVEQTATVGDILIAYDKRVVPAHKSAADEHRRIASFLKHPFSRVAAIQLTPAVLADYRDERLRTVKPGTVLRELNIIRAALNCADDFGIKVAAAKVKRPATPASRDRVLQADEEPELLKACRASSQVYLESAVVFALQTAMRQGEILKLRRRDIDWSRCVARLTDTKNGSSRETPLSTRAREVLNALLPCPALPTDNRLVFGGVELSHAFGRAVKLAKIQHITYHDLRHTAASRLARKMSTVQLQAITGHKTLSMLQRYVHIQGADLVHLLG